MEFLIIGLVIGVAAAVFFLRANSPERREQRRLDALSRLNERKSEEP